MTRPRQPYRRWILPGALLAVLLAIGGWLLLFSEALSVRSVRVEGASRVPVAQVLSVARAPAHVPLLRVDTAAIERRVEGIRDVESAAVHRSWPRSLVIVVRERTPIAVSGTMVLDRYGVATSASAGGLPELTTADPALIRAGLAVLTSLPADLAARVREVRVPSPEGVTLRLSSGIVVVWGGPDRPGDKARVLEQLMRRNGDVYDVSSTDVATIR